MGRWHLGALSIVFGLALLFNHLITVVFLLFVLGTFAVAGGILAIVASFMMRKSSATGVGDARTP